MTLDVAVRPVDAALTRLEAARADLELVTTVDEAKDVRDKAEALRLYAKQARMGMEWQNRFAELKLRAERRAGELLAVDVPLAHGGDRRSSERVSLETLGIDSHQNRRWQHIARIPEPDFELFLKAGLVEGRELTTAAVLKLAKRLAAADKPDVDPPSYQPVGDLTEFPCIVIDPPWRYDNVATRGAAEDHYPTMSLDELAALELPAAPDAHLYLWVTNGFLREGFDLMETWGFTYKACLTWCKPQIGMGNYFRNSTEHVLFGLRGKLPTLANNVPTWFLADRTRHSAKPESFYDLVEKSSPGPHMEMFARRRRMGWHTWGNEA